VLQGQARSCDLRIPFPGIGGKSSPLSFSFIVYLEHKGDVLEQDRHSTPASTAPV
jgi:hypothetical protein